MHYANHVLFICFCGFKDKITKDFTPSKTFRFRSNCKVQIHTILAYMNNRILSLFPFAPPHFSAPSITPAITAKLSISFLWGCRHPHRSNWACRRYHLETWTHTNPHTHTHTHIHAERKVFFLWVFFLLGCIQEVGGKFLFQISRYTTNKQLLVCS